MGTRFNVIGCTLFALGVMFGVSACDGAPAPCNGGQELCDRAYDEVAYVTTHNAMSNAQDGWQVPNQQYNMPAQLAAGVRGLMLDTHYQDGVAMLCHGFCSIGSQPLTEGLGQIDEFIEAHPDQVVTIILESYISHDDTAAAFTAAGLDDNVYVHSPGQPWPTLAQMIDAGTTLVVFQDRSMNASYPWLMNIWDNAWETHYAAKVPAEFSCAVNRGNTANPLFIFNHFLTDLVGSRERAEQVNHNPFLLERAQQCQAESGSLPNFVSVDFYDIGDVSETVAALNGLTTE